MEVQDFSHTDNIILLLEILKYGASNFSVLSPFPSLTALPTLHYDNLNIVHV